MIKHLATASCMTILLASCDLINPTENQSPTVNFTTTGNVVDNGGFYTGTAPVTLTFDSATSTDDSAIDSVLWMVNGVEVSTDAVLVYPFSQANTYEVAVTITDDEGKSSTKHTTIILAADSNNTPINQAPVAVITPPSNLINNNTYFTGTAPISVAFNSNSSSDDNGIVSREWKIDGQTYSSNAIFTHSFTSASNYQIELKVTDSENLSSSQFMTVQIVNPQDPNNNEPVVTVGSDITVNVGETFALTGTASDADGDALTSIWTIAGQEYPGLNVTPSAINAKGTYNATLTVFDGKASVSETITVYVNEVDSGNTPPQVDAGNNISVSQGETFTLNGSATDAEDQNTLEYTWSINNLTLGGAQVSTSISNAGTYQAILSVFDGESTATDSITVTVARDVAPGDESYTSGTSTMPSQYDLFTIENCGVNTVLPNNEFLIIGGVVIDSAFGWNHIDSTFGDWAGLTKQPSDYDFGQTGYNATDANCNNKDTYNAVLVKKLHDWNEAHSNGFKYSVDASNPTFEEMDVITLDIYFDANDSSIPTKADITSAYSSQLSAAQITALDGNGDFQLDIQLNVDLPNPSNPPTLYYDTEGDIHGTINLNLTAAQANKWLRLEIPVDSLIFREETANWGVTEVNYEDVKHLSPGDISFVAESKSRNTVRHLLDDSVKNDDAAFANANITKLFKEQSFRIKQLSISTADSNGLPVNTPPSVNIGANQTVSENDQVMIVSSVSDIDGDSLDYQWTIDGNNFSTNNNFSNSFATAGSYVVSLSVDDGTDVTTRSVTVTVEGSGGGCSTTGAPVEMYGDLYVEGSKIKGCGAQNVQLRGMSMFWSQWSSQYYNRSVVDTLVDEWNVSVLRSATGIDTDLDGYANPANKAAEWSNTVALIDAALARDVYVIVDFHTHYAEDYVNEAKEFFTRVAQTYGNNPHIIYEIYNEPLNGPDYNDDPNWWASTIKPYAEEVIPVIRAIDPDNLIIVGTRTWSQRVDEAANNPISAANNKNVAYTIHFYADTHKQSVRDYVEYAVSQGIAVFSTEWGMSHANGGTMCPDGQRDWDACDSETRINDNTINIPETEAWLDLFDRNDISWLNWSIMDKEESSSALLPGASATGGWNNSELSPAGIWMKNKLNSY